MKVERQRFALIEKRVCAGGLDRHSRVGDKYLKISNFCSEYEFLCILWPYYFPHKKSPLHPFIRLPRSRDNFWYGGERGYLLRKKADDGIFEALKRVHSKISSYSSRPP